MNILLSAIAGDIGFGAGRILRSWGWLGEIHGVDLHSLHPGPVIFDKVGIAPPATATPYLKWLENYVTRHGVQIFVPTSEAELAFFAAKNLSSINGAKILINSPGTISLSLDKLACMSFLAEKGLAVPDNGLVGEADPKLFPVIVKPRFGRGGRGVKRINSQSEFKKRARKGEVWQEYLSPEDGEYTCAIYRGNHHQTRTLSLKRELHYGSTSRGEVVFDTEIDRYLTQIAEALDVNGAINVQLRLTNRGPRLFEINPRLSSTLVFRDKMGFQDLRWWLADALGTHQTPPLAEVSRPAVGTQFFRGSAEYIIHP